MRVCVARVGHMPLVSVRDESTDPRDKHGSPLFPSPYNNTLHCVQWAFKKNKTTGQFIMDGTPHD